MFRDPYATTPCRGYAGAIATAIKQLKEHRIIGGEQLFWPKGFDDPKKQYYFGRFLGNGSAQIPQFAHPVLVPRDNSYHGRTQEQFDIFMDVRNCTRQMGDTYGVSNPLDLKQNFYRGFFTSVLCNNPHGADDLRNIGIFPMRVYSRWISQSLTRRLALAPEHQMTTGVLAGYFYAMMLRDGVEGETELGEREKTRIASLISRATMVPVDNVLKIIDPLPLVREAKDLVDLLINHSGSMRFEKDKFNLAVFYSCINGSWMGSNFREVTAVALEHIPTWLAIVTIAALERGVNKTMIGDIVFLANKHDDLKQFLMNVKNLLDNETEY